MSVWKWSLSRGVDVWYRNFVSSANINTLTLFNNFWKIVYEYKEE